ncbi:hypothetical protein [Vibrio salilacus]|uniref:hypothetical protein n=1 Tax=Vibrio salilacus TaxID=1323749 RepID=UPI000C2A0848|nr:hypothetical protein [Vibrio salilacus]
MVGIVVADALTYRFSNASELKGYVGRVPSEQDERVLKFTPSGLVLKQQAIQVPEQMTCKFHLYLDELISLKRLCEKVLRHIE